MVVNDVVEEHTADPAKVTVDGGESTLDKGPSLRLVVVDLGVVVVKVGNGHYFFHTYMVSLIESVGPLAGVIFFVDKYLPSQW